MQFTEALPAKINMHLQPEKQQTCSGWVMGEDILFITKECDYAIRIIRALADRSIRTAKAVCDKENVPLPYAYKILKKLESAGIVKSHRGAYGGYRLALEADKLTLYDIILPVEADMLLFECATGDFRCPQNTPEQPCKVNAEFRRLQAMLVNELKGKSIAEILGQIP